MSYAPHPFSLRQLQYALAVAGTLSFRKAAELCHVSQPALSAQLRELEGAIGVTLFERDRTRVLPTAAGAAVLERARRILADAEDLLLAARSSGDPRVGRLRIGVIPTISPYLLPPLTPLISDALAQLSIAWVEDRTEPLLEALSSGALDAVLLALEAELGDVAHARIATDPFVLASSMQSPLTRRGPPLRATEVRGAELLLLDEGHCMRDQVLSWCARRGVHETALRATSLPTLVQMVAAGAGTTLLPALAVRAETERSRIRVRALAPAPHRTLVLAWRRSSPLEPVLREIAALAERAYREACSAPRRGARRSHPNG